MALDAPSDAHGVGPLADRASPGTGLLSDGPGSLEAEERLEGSPPPEGALQQSSNPGQ